MLSRVYIWRTRAAGSRSGRAFSPHPAPGTPPESAELPGRCRCPLAAPGAGPAPEHGALREGSWKGWRGTSCTQLWHFTFPRGRGLPNGQELLISPTAPSLRRICGAQLNHAQGRGLRCWVAQGHGLWDHPGAEIQPFPSSLGNSGSQLSELPPALPLPLLEGLRPEGRRGKPLQGPQKTPGGTVPARAPQAHPPNTLILAAGGVKASLLLWNSVYTK